MSAKQYNFFKKHSKAIVDLCWKHSGSVETASALQEVGQVSVEAAYNLGLITFTDVDGVSYVTVIF